MSPEGATHPPPTGAVGGSHTSDPVASPWLVIWLIVGGAWGWAVFFASSASEPGGRWPFTSLCWFGWYALVALAWLIFSCVRPIWSGSAWQRTVWLSVPLAGVVSGVMAFTDLDLTARVWLWEADLKQYVDQQAVDADTYTAGHHPTRSVGSFGVYRTFRYKGGVYLFMGASGLFTDAGIAYLPQGAELPTPVRARRLYGNWYRVDYYD